MKGYKAFKKGMICEPVEGKPFQYAENTVFEQEEDAIICESGFHFCKEPLDVLDYYPLVDGYGNQSEFAEVEALDDCTTNDLKKYCTKKLKIGAKLSFADLIQASLTFEKESSDEIENSSGDCARIGSSGYDARIGSSGYNARIGSSGGCAQIGSSGDCARIGLFGYNARIGSSGGCAQIGSSGNFARIGSSGDRAQIGSSGNFAQIGSSGDYAWIGSSGNYAWIGSSGNSAQIGSSGNFARIGSSGDDARIGSPGNYAQIGSSGDYAWIISEGKNSVICCAGTNSCVRAKKGSWITLAEWEWDEEKERKVPVCVKTEFVDGETIKEDVFYRLKNGEFEEVE